MRGFSLDLCLRGFPREADVAGSARSEWGLGGTLAVFGRCGVYFDLEQVIDYALLLKSATTTAKVGFFLEQHRDALMVEETHLDKLRKHAPKLPCYLERSRRESGKLAASWNLIVPPAVLERAWEEVA